MMKMLMTKQMQSQMLILKLNKVSDNEYII